MRSKSQPEIKINRKIVSQKLGMMLRILRRERSFSQTDLGKMIGTVFQQIQKYESGKSDLTVYRLIQICTALDVPFEEVMCRFYYEIKLDLKYQVNAGDAAT